ncbi:MAG TPA: nucleoside triphosphate pyrophosphohydrolase family protein [Flavipsychrobacter sp.]
MDFETYQTEAKKTQQLYKDDETINEVIPFLGIVGETGSVVAELKKRIRDGENYSGFNSQLEEELGDVLWYVANLASNYQLTLDNIAEKNLKKIRERWLEEDLDSYKILDEEYPEEEQFPREFEVRFFEYEESGKVKIRLEYNGKQIGDPITDNAHENDGYRYHDIFHFGYVAFLGWSPVLRKLMKIKRKSEDIIDEVEDGARAAIVEELVSLFVYSHAQNHQLFKYTDRVDSEILRDIQRLVSKIEVKDCTTRQWETAIIQSYRVLDELQKNKGGRVLVSIKNKKLLYLGKN